MELTTKQLDSLAADVQDLALEAAGEAGEYLEGFGRYVADFLASLLIDPDETGLERLEAQTEAVLETIAEIADQATRKSIALAVVRAARFLTTVAAAA